jgi:hypothetical protein
MASQRNTPPADSEFIQEPDDNLQIPEEFTGAGYSNNGTAMNGSLTLEQLNELGFDDERDEAELAKLNPPTGDWMKSDTWELSQNTYTDNNAPGDIDPAGRTVFVITGKPEPRTANGMEYQPTLRIRISPDKRYKQDEPTKVDGLYKLFLEAKELYLAMKGEKVRKMGQLLKMLCEDSYVARTMKGDNNPVVQLKLKTQMRR